MADLQEKQMTESNAMNSVLEEKVSKVQIFLASIFSMQTFKTPYSLGAVWPFRPTKCNLLGDFLSCTLPTIFLTDYLLSVQGLAQLVSARSSVRKAPCSVHLFTDTTAILNYFDLRSIMGCPGGHDYDPVYSLSIRNMAFTLNFSGKRRSLLHPNTAQRSFPHYNLILRKLLETIPWKALVNSDQNLVMPPGHPIILLKSNLFNMAAVSVKGLFQGVTSNPWWRAWDLFQLVSTVAIYTARMRVMFKCPATSLKLFPSMCLWI